MKSKRFKFAYLATIPAIAAATLGTAIAQTSYTSTSATGAWNTARWNNSTDGPTYTSNYTANNSVSFTAGTYSFAGMGAVVNVGDITLADNVTVSFSSIGSTFATNGAVRTISVGSGSLFDLSTQAISTTSGTGFIKNGSGVFATAGSSYNGGFTLNAGTIIMRGVNAMGGGAVTLNGGIVASNANRDVTPRYTSFSIAGNVQFGELSTNVTIASSTANLTFADNVSLGAANRVLTLGNNGVQTFSGVISNTSGGITFAANSGVTGRFAITNTANTFTGNINITGGEARFTADGSLGNAANDVIVDGGRLSFASGFTLGGGRDVFLGDGTGTSIDVVSGTQIINTVIANKSGETGSFSKQGTGTLELGGANTFSGSTTVAAGTLTLTNGLALQNSALDTAASITGTSSAGLKTTATALTLGGLSGNKDLSSIFTTTSGGFGSVTAVTLNPQSGSVSYSGVIANGAGNMTLTKTGAGTQVLSGINTYTGSTTIREGTLSLSGTGTLGTGAVILDGGTLNITGLTAGSYTLSGSQTLSGSGSINATGKNLIVDSILAPGFSPGTIDVTGDLTLGMLSVSNFEITGTGAGEFDQLIVSDTLTYGGTLNLLTTYVFQLGDTVQLFDAGTFTGTFSNITGTDLGGGFSWNTSNLYTTGSISVIPEPATALLGGLGILALLRRRRRVA